MPPFKLLIFTGAVVTSYLLIKLYKICREKTSQETDKAADEETLDEKEKENEEDEEEEVEVGEKETNAIPNQKKEPKKKFQKKEREKMMRFIKVRPNFFIGFQIYDAGIHEKVKKLQEEIIAKNPALHSALINISTLHVTLAVTRLANKSDIESIKEKLDDWADRNEDFYFNEPFTLNFTGIKTFRNVVAYLDIEPCENKEKLVSLSKSINNLLSSAGFTTDQKSFTPHVTILKLSQNYKLLKARKSFLNDFESLKNCKEHFGKQDISSLQLLSMDHPKDEKGYYKCFHQIFVKDPKIEADSSDCGSPVLKHKKLDSDEK